MNLEFDKNMHYPYFAFMYNHSASYADSYVECAIQIKVKDPSVAYIADRERTWLRFATELSAHGRMATKIDEFSIS